MPLHALFYARSRQKVLVGVSAARFAAPELLEPLLDQPMHAELLELRRQRQDLVGLQRMLFVNDVEDALERDPAGAWRRDASSISFRYKP